MHDDLLRQPRRWISAALAILLALTAVADDPPEARRPSYRNCAVIEFHEEITPLTEQLLNRKLEIALADGADLIVLEIDSPGGALLSSENLASRLRDLDAAHTVAYIPRSAMSGAAMMALGCDEIVMGKQALLGDVGVIQMDEGWAFRYAPEKLQTPVMQFMADLAAARGRPPALAAAMVDMDLIVYHVRHRTTGEETYMSADEIAASGQPDQWERLNPVHESREGAFLTVNGTRAVELHLAERTAGSVDELLQEMGYDGPVQRLARTTEDTVVMILNSPWITGLLFVIGMVALYIEFSVPGIGVGGLVAGLCFVLFFWSRFLGGTAGWLEVVLFAAGITFLLVELFVFPGFGVAGVSGLLLILASLVLALQGFVIPEQDRDVSLLLNNLLVLTISGATFLVLAVVISRYLGAIPIVSRIMLPPPEANVEDTEIGKEDVSGEAPLAPGDVGVATSALRPAGKGRFGSRYVDCMTDGEFIEDGAAIRIVQISGNRVLVAAREETA